MLKHMILVISKPSRGEVQAETKAIRKASARITESKASAKKYLLDSGFITKSGKLTKRYSR